MTGGIWQLLICYPQTIIKALVTKVNKRVHCVRAGQFTSDHDIQGTTTVNWVGQEPRLVCCVFDNYQQAINTLAAPRFLRARYWIGTEPQNCINWSVLDRDRSTFPWTVRTLIVYYYNDAQRYEQFLQVGRLYWALFLVGLAPLCLRSSK